MKLVKNASLALIILPASVGCLEEPATDDASAASAAGPMGSMTGAQPPATTGAASTAMGPATTPPAMTMAPATPAGAPPAAGGDTAAGASAPVGDTATGAMGDTAMGASAMGDTAMGASAMGDTAMGASAMGDTATAEPEVDELDPDTLIPGLDGLFMAFRTVNPNDPGDSKYYLTGVDEECPVGDSWATSGITRSQEYQVMGTPGQKYLLDFELRGALALRCYADGTPTGMAPDPAGINQAFYVGGQQFGDSPLNTLELAVTPPVADEAASTYFLNGIPSTSEMCDALITYDVGYAAQIAVMGDSMITLGTHSSDCQVPQNCGADPAGVGCEPRTVDVSGLQIKASPMQPIFDYVGGAEFYPQWFVFDIKNITKL